jgi:Delta3-Delta2-enoyl-CoA isomerase
MLRSTIEEKALDTQLVERVLSRVKDDLELVREGPIFFLVMNQGKDNVFDDNYIAKMSQLLDTVNESEGAACMITLSTSKRRFSTGFNLDYWLAAPLNSYTSMANLQMLYGKLIGLSVPTLAVIGGHCFAGGLIFALSHDFRIMKKNSGKLCLSEINIGRGLPPAFDTLCAAMLPMNTYRQLMFGIQIDS